MGRTAIVALLLLAAAAGARAFGPRCPPGRNQIHDQLDTTTLAPPANFKVAFIGDQGLGSSSVYVLNMIKKEGSDIVVHSGDFDYDSDPEAWMEQLESVLGDDYPYFASIGNHDIDEWDGYQEQLLQHSRRANLSCDGDIGVQMTCTHKGMVIILSGVGTRLGDMDHADYITSQLSQQDNIWKIVSWHKNHRNYQIGDKSTEVGLDVYDAALAQGAILATGHEHSYARTHLMSSFSEYTVVDKNNTINIEEGKSFVFVSGLGGQSIRDWDDDLIRNPWWAAYAAEDNDVGDGVLFCTFHINNDPRLAECFFVDNNGVEFDRFHIYSKLDGNKRKTSVPLARPRRHQIHEMAVMSSEDDFSTDAQGNIIQGNHLLLGSGYTATLRFRTFPLHQFAGKHDSEVHLQLYGASSGPLPSFEIRAMVGANELTKTVINWDYEEDGFEKESVWVSPDIVPLLEEATSATSTGVTLVITGKGERKVWATDKDDCVAPTLSIVPKA